MFVVNDVIAKSMIIMVSFLKLNNVSKGSTGERLKLDRLRRVFILF